MSKGDHKRKARPIAPAVVTCDADSITVVIPDVLGKNESHQGGRYLSPATKNLRASVERGVGALLLSNLQHTDAGKTGRLAATGAWRAEILACWDRKRETIKGREIGFIAPLGDVDAPIAQMFDALQHAGILDDDARVVEVRAWNMYRKGVRATVVRLVRVHDLVERDRDIMRLTRLVPDEVVPAFKVGDRVKCLGEGRSVFVVVEAQSPPEFPNTVHLHQVVGRKRVDHGREAVTKLERLS